jgi:hypothetical protein
MRGSSALIAKAPPTPRIKPPMKPAISVSIGRGEKGELGLLAAVSTVSVGSPACLTFSRAMICWLSSVVLAPESCNCWRSPVSRLSASALTTALRCDTTPLANPLAMSRASSGESASALTATTLLWATGSALTLLRSCSGLPG